MNTTNHLHTIGRAAICRDTFQDADARSSGGSLDEFKEQGQHPGQRIITADAIKLDLRVTNAQVKIGGRVIDVKRYQCDTAPQMADFLNTQELIRNASPLVDSLFINRTIDGVRAMFTGSKGFDGKSMKGLMAAIMPLLMAPDPSVIFAGQCDASITKGVVSGAIMTRIKAEIPRMIPDFISSTFFGGADSAADSVAGAAGSGMSVMPIIKID
jgi:hypothetical protein